MHQGMLQPLVNAHEGMRLLKSMRGDRKVAMWPWEGQRERERGRVRGRGGGVRGGGVGSTIESAGEEGSSLNEIGEVGPIRGGGRKRRSNVRLQDQE